MIYGSVCSGIEAAAVAWEPLGWRAAWFAEIDSFPSAVLKHHYPEVRNYGDFTRIPVGAGPIDALVGGTPCQDFSVAGLRAGLDGERGNLTLEFLKLAGRLRPRWLVWENVPGVLSIDGGRAFGAVLGGLAQLGYGFAYRVLDAQYFGVPQRRRRVFVIGNLGDWRAAAAVLFERYSLSGHPPPRREAREGIAPTISARTKGGGGLGTDFDCDGGLVEVAMCLNAKGGLGRIDGESETFIADTLTVGANQTTGFIGEAVPHVTHALCADGFDASEDGTGIPFDLAQITSKTNRSTAEPGNPAGTLSSDSNLHVALLPVNGVRRLTPRECERLQGFPDDYTLISYRGKPAADGPRYKALGNSFAVPVVRWLGERLDAVEGIAR